MSLGRAPRSGGGLPDDRANCGSVLIVEPPGKLFGIVTEQDLMTRVLAKAPLNKTPLSLDVMTRNPVLRDTGDAGVGCR